MRHLPMILLATLLLARPQPVQAKAPALDVPGLVEAGQRLEIRWDGLSASVEEVELELSLDGGRWVRISPELEARDGRYLWHVPAVASAHARIRLRAGGADAREPFEAEAATSTEFRIESRESVAGVRADWFDWWRVGESAGARGWERGRTATTLSDERSTNMAEPDSRSQGCLPVRSGDCALLGGRTTNAAPCTAKAEPAASCRYPLRR